MAEVYLAKAFGRLGFERIFAVKRILPHYAGDPDFVAMFRDEANIVRRLNHANIVQVVDFDEIGGSVAMIMEFVEGIDLRALLAACEKSGSRISIPHALFLGREVARALSYAHNRVDDATGEPLNMVHRDISPQNVLISYAGEVKIIDFGVARMAASKLNETKPGTVKGKYSYMSPEQLNAKDLDGRTDVFSLGIVLWEIIAMRRLFNGDTEVDTIRRVQECRLPDGLRTYNKEATEELQALVEKALAKEPDQRYASAAEFERCISTYLNKHHPSFTASEIGNFAARMTSSRRTELQRNIRKALALSPSMAQKISSSHAPASLQQSMRPTGSTAVFSRSMPPQSQASMSTASSLSQTSQIRTSSRVNLRDAYAAGYRSGMRPNSSARPLVTGQLRSAFARTATMATQQFLKEKLKTPLNPTTLALVAITALVIISVGYMLLNLPQRPDNPLVKFELATVPARVQIQVDGEFRFDNRYIQTPLTLKIPPGKRRVTVMREGFRAVTFTLDGDPGQTLRSRPVRLNPDAKIPLMSLRVVAKKAGTFRFNANDGYQVGTLPANFELPSGKDHKVAITDERGIESKCLIKVKSQQTNKTLVLTFDSIAETPKCSISYE